jgi:uncharacterized protein (TIGR00255 family)
MIKSMTGYGSARGAVCGLDLTVEVKSVNNRYLDTTVKLPRSLLFAEDQLKSAVQQHISRGKVDVFVTVSAAASDDTQVRVNEPLLQSYVAALHRIGELTGTACDLNAMSLSRLPDVLTLERRDTDTEALGEGLLAVAQEALAEYDAMRAREGAKLREDVLCRIGEIGRLTGIVEENAPRTVADYRARLEQKLREVLEGKSLDEGRIITEAAIFADRVAVDEETVRLRSHLSQLTGLVTGQSPVGRKMDFLIQELNRESNTIGSKCQSAELAHVVVDLKSEIEKIREQIQNVE